MHHTGTALAAGDLSVPFEPPAIRERSPREFAAGSISVPAKPPGSGAGHFWQGRVCGERRGGRARLGKQGQKAAVRRISPCKATLLLYPFGTQVVKHNYVKSISKALNLDSTRKFAENRLPPLIKDSRPDIIMEVSIDGQEESRPCPPMQSNTTVTRKEHGYELFSRS